MYTGKILSLQDIEGYIEYLEESLIQNYNYATQEEGTKEAQDISEVNFNHEGFAVEFGDDIEDYSNVKTFCEEVGYYGRDNIIPDSKIEDYIICSVEETYDMTEIPRIIYFNIDWKGVANDLKQDYTVVEYEGEPFYVN